MLESERQAVYRERDGSAHAPVNGGPVFSWDNFRFCFCFFVLFLFFLQNSKIALPGVMIKI